MSTITQAAPSGAVQLARAVVKSWKVREWTTVVGADAQVKLPDVL